MTTNTAPDGATASRAHKKDMANPFLKAITEAEETELLNDPEGVEAGRFTVIEGGKGAPPPEAAWDEPNWNDAYEYGEDVPGWRALLARSMKLSNANSIDSPKWKTQEYTFYEWLNAPPHRFGCGFTYHPVAPRKEGSAIMFGALVSDSRHKSDVVTVDAIGLDQDDGPDPVETAERLEEAGIAAVIYTSFNDQATESAFKRDVVLRKLKLDRDPTDAEIAEYMRGEAKYRDTTCASAKIIDPSRHVKGGVKIIVSHQPLNKCRIILPLEERATLTEHAATQTAALALFADKIIGAAVHIVGIHPDMSCTDPSRGFYLPRHREDTDPCSIVVRGKPLAYEDIPAVSKGEYVNTLRGNKSASARPTTPDGTDLMAWAAKGYDKRFLAADAVDQLTDKVRRHVTADKVEIECPFDDGHSNAGDPKDTACYVANGDGEKGFQWGCGHDSCKVYDRLDFMAKAFADGWFDGEEFLTDKDAGFLIWSDEDEDEDGGGSASAEREPAQDYDAASHPDWLPAPYFIKGSNINIRIKSKNKDNPDRAICQVFDVLGRTSNATGDDDAGRVLSFTNENGETVEKVLDRADIYNDGRAVIAVLARAGMRFARRGKSHADDLLDLLAAIVPEQQIPVVKRPGFIRDRAGDVVGFMCPTGEYIDAGRGGPLTRLSDKATTRDRHTGGTLAGWKKAASAAFDVVEQNFYWSFALAAGCAGPVMGLLAEASCGFNFSGRTSKGKTIAQRGGASIWAAPKDQEGVFFPMNSTTNAVEDLACIGSETVLCLDDIGNMARPQDLSPMLFGLSGSAGKARKSGRGAGLAEGAEYRVFTIFSNERGLKTTIERAGKVGDFKGGLAVRFPDIDVTGGAKQSPDVIAALDGFKTNFGHAGPAFVKWLIAEKWVDRGEELKRRVSAAQIAIAGADATEQRHRAARVFALVQVAGELAAEAGILPDAEKVQIAVALAWESFMGSDEGSTTQGGESLLDGLRSYLARNMNKTVVDATDANSPGYANIIGWYDDDLFVLDYDAIKSIQVLGLSGTLSDLLDALGDAEALVREGKNRTHKNLPLSVRFDNSERERKVKNIRIDRKALGL